VCPDLVNCNPKRKSSTWRRKKNLRDTSRGTGVKLDKAKKTNLVVSKSNGHGTSHQPSPPYYDLLKKSVKMILLKK
jgi:hypothetical protein